MEEWPTAGMWMCYTGWFNAQCVHRVRACQDSLAVGFTFRLFSIGTGRRGWKAFSLIRILSDSFHRILRFLWLFLKDQRHSFIRTARTYKDPKCSPKSVRDPLLRPFNFALITGGLRHPMGLVRLGRLFRRFARRRPGGFDEARDRSGSGGRENQWWDRNIWEPFGSKSFQCGKMQVFLVSLEWLLLGWSPQMVKERGIGDTCFIVMDEFADPYRRSGAQYVYD